MGFLKAFDRVKAMVDICHYLSAIKNQTQFGQLQRSYEKLLNDLTQMGCTTEESQEQNEARIIEQLHQFQEIRVNVSTFVDGVFQDILTSKNDFLKSNTCSISGLPSILIKENARNMKNYFMKHSLSDIWEYK